MYKNININIRKILEIDRRHCVKSCLEMDKYFKSKGQL